MNYPELVAAVGETLRLNDPVFVASIPRYIVAAEHKIFTDLKLPAVMSSGTATVAIGATASVFTAGGPVLNIRSIQRAGSGGYLLPKAVDFLQEMYPGAVVGVVPKYYAVSTVSATTVSLQIAPIDGVTASTLNINFDTYPASITTDPAGTSWLGTHFDQLLLYAVLVEASIANDIDDQRRAYFHQTYQSLVESAKGVMSHTNMDNYR